jgi:ABC-type sugar transport system substrate-binding protein
MTLGFRLWHVVVVVAAHRIALFLQNAANDYQCLLRDDCQAAATRHDFLLTVHSADNDGEVQLRQIRTVLASPRSQWPAAILVTPVREVGLRAVVHEAANQGIGWVSLNRWSDYLLELRREFARLPVFSVTADQTEVGRIQGRQLRCLLGDVGELVYIQGPLGTSSAQKRTAGLRQEIERCPDVRLVSFHSDWSSEGGEKVMRDWIHIFPRGKLPRFVVGAQNDSMASGARRALLEWAGSEEKMSSICLTGCDGTPAFGQRLVKEGKLTATVVIPSVGGKAIEELALALAGGRPTSTEIVVSVSSYPALETLAKEHRRKP